MFSLPKNCDRIWPWSTKKLTLFIGAYYASYTCFHSDLFPLFVQTQKRTIGLKDSRWEIIITEAKSFNKSMNYSDKEMTSFDKNKHVEQEFEYYRLIKSYVF